MTRRFGFVVVGLLVLVMASRSGRAQLIPLLPPPAGESAEESTPQQSKSAQLIQADLVAERFDELDQMADRFRSSKGRMPGGGWKLQVFYQALDQREPNDAATVEHLTHIEHWMAAKPDSITARVAAAQSLHQWAWLARGSGLADTVTPEMAKLFFARIERDEEVLKAAEKMQPMCPQWYSEMMTVGLAEGWDRAKMQDMFDRATQFEPGYLSFYRDFANYLLPKWEGHPGDAAAFAKTAADRVGGDEGDLIYFEFATVVIKRGNGGIPTKQMDWERIKRGARVLGKDYGQSRTTVNQFAFMAWKYRDAAVAGPLFAEIGERWAPGVWKEKENYTLAREWAQSGKGLQGAQGPGAGTAMPPQ
jgi:hypothetical protein